MSDATPEGAELSVHDQILATIDPQEEVVEEAVTEEEIAPEAQEEISAEPQETEDEVSPVEEPSETLDASEEEGIPLSDIAAVLGLDEDRFDLDDEGKVFIKTKVDGEEGKVKPSDLLKSYQLEGHLNKQNMEVVEAKKALEQERERLQALSNQKTQEAESVVQLAWTELNREIEAFNQSDLRQDQPEEWAARQIELQQRQNNLTQAYQKLQTDKQSELYNYTQQYKQHLQAENQKICDSIEGWHDNEKATKEYGEITSYLKTGCGYKQEDITGVFDQNGNLVQPGLADHRIVVMARKAMLYDQLQKTKPAITKRVVKTPKAAKSGAPQDVDLKAKAAADALNRVKKTGGKNGSVRDYLIATGKV